jgi:hypothetical protein
MLRLSFCQFDPFLSFRMNMRNLSVVFVLTDVTIRSLTGVYAEYNEVFEMTWVSRRQRKVVTWSTSFYAYIPIYKTHA